jgi:hypothetical protein
MAPKHERGFWLTMDLTNFKATPGIQTISPAGVCLAYIRKSEI